MSDIGERVKKIVVEHLGVEPDKVVEGASFIDDLGADSLDTVELVMELEEEFDINIPDDAAEKIQTVGQAIEYRINVTATTAIVHQWPRPCRTVAFAPVRINDFTVSTLGAGVSSVLIPWGENHPVPG